MSSGRDDAAVDYGALLCAEQERLILSEFSQCLKRVVATGRKRAAAASSAPPLSAVSHRPKGPSPSPHPPAASRIPPTISLDPSLKGSSFQISAQAAASRTIPIPRSS
eukprot:TRINITY_DN21094_c0_g1_i1.p1 TRINITY_DN21094_c0_g1~~TRINITY_DN21094_c0_g1_i1.p1  ORF type:complete len:124 (+),score=23.64 TRINITY_DN21094_c0_g1_i1:51-374(+)